MNAYNSILEMIGQTPLLRLERLAPAQEIFAKCEFLNPISLKDRPVLQIIENAEKEGRIKPGDTLIEVTSGNTGMAVASIAVVKGYKAILVMSEILFAGVYAWFLLGERLAPVQMLGTLFVIAGVAWLSVKH